MSIQKYSIAIQASKRDVWKTMWNDSTFRMWAGVTDPGTYMVGELVEGKTVQFISSENGYGVTSIVAELRPEEYVLLKHSADTQNEGQQSRKDQWTGGSEQYLLTQHDDITTLSTEFDVPLELETYFAEAYPKALNVIKQQSEHCITK